jgi:hypothetical protein
MASIAEAITDIREHVVANGRMMGLAEVKDTHDNSPAGMALDREERIHVTGLDNEALIPDGVLWGIFAVRALLVDLNAADQFISDAAGEQGITMLRARLTYGLTLTDYCAGGTVTHRAIYGLREGDGALLDGYFAANSVWSAAHRANVRAMAEGRPATEAPDPGERPEKPFVFTQYLLDAPEPPKLAGDDPEGNQLSERSLQAGKSIAHIIAATQAGYPETTIISSATQGQIVQEELPLLASWFIQR